MPKLAIRQQRRLLGWTQMELAVKSDSSLSTVCAWEQGRVNPSKQKLDKLACLFGVPKEDIRLIAPRRRFN